MDDRVHPRPDSPPQPADLPKLTLPPSSPRKPAPPTPENPVPQPSPGTYVIQIPKDQVYRVPPPENASRFSYLSRRKPRRSCCARLCCTLLVSFIALILLSAVAAAVFYFVFRPESPHYSIESVSISGFNLTTSAPISPELGVTVKADNPNDKIGFYYRSGSSINVFYKDVKFGSGSLPVFYQGTNNVTKFTTALKGSGIELTGSTRKALIDEQKKGTVPLRLDLRAPVKIKVGSVKTWEIVVKVDCDLTLDKLTANAKIVSRKCDYGVKLWS